MGGDHGPEVIIPGAAISLERRPQLQFQLVGDKARIETALAAHTELRAKSTIVHTDIEIAMDDKPSQAVRRGKGSSMWMAIDAVKNDEADVVVSAGNTGALMAMAKLILRPVAVVGRAATHRLRPSGCRCRAAGHCCPLANG